MKLRLLDIIVCPACKDRFEITKHESEWVAYSPMWRSVLEGYLDLRNGINSTTDGLDPCSYEEHIVSGELFCQKCNRSYPISHGIPVLLSPELRTVQAALGRVNPRIDSKLSRPIDQTTPVQSSDTGLFDAIQKANQSNYGYEWKVFSHEYQGWECNYDKYYVFEDEKFFKGKIGYDAGCGMGRYSLVPVNRGAEVIGLDLSNAVEAAYEKSKSVPLLHVVQGDIYNPPFRNDYFDFAQTLGVIHHTPDPEQALSTIKETTQPHGKIWIYVYPSFKDENKLRYYLLKIVNRFRCFTVRMPSHYLYWLLYFVLFLVLILLYWPSKILWHLGFRKISTILPYNYEQYRGRSVRDIHMNLFDRFGNPVERRYDRDDIQIWMDRAGFRSFRIWFKNGWTIGAVK